MGEFLRKGLIICLLVITFIFMFLGLLLYNPGLAIIGVPVSYFLLFKYHKIM